MFVHELKKPQLNLGLVQEGFLVLDDLDGHPLLLMVVIGFHHLHKKEQISVHLARCFRFTTEKYSSNIRYFTYDLTF